MEVVLDTNFIIEMVKNKVDILDIIDYGKITIPRQVLIELEKISVDGDSEDNKIAELALRVIENNEDKISIIELEKKYVDLGIEKYAKNNRIILATIDLELKKKLAGKARILTLMNRKKLVLL